MNNKKGISALAIIAVIAVLAAVGLLVVPKVIKHFEDVKKDNLIKQIDDIKLAAENKYKNDASMKEEVSVFCSSDDLFNKNNTSAYVNPNGLLADLSDGLFGSRRSSSKSQLDVAGFQYFTGPCKSIGIDIEADSYIAVMSKYGNLTAIGIQDKNYCYVSSNITDEIDKEAFAKGTLTCENSYCTCGGEAGFYVNKGSILDLLDNINLFGDSESEE